MCQLRPGWQCSSEQLVLNDTYDSASVVSFADKRSHHAHTGCQLLSRRAADFSYLAGLHRSMYSIQSRLLMAKLSSEVPRPCRGWSGDFSCTCSRTASLVKSAGSLQSVSDHGSQVIQRWTTGAVHYCLRCVRLAGYNCKSTSTD